MQVDTKKPVPDIALYVTGTDPHTDLRSQADNNGEHIFDGLLAGKYYRIGCLSPTGLSEGGTDNVEITLREGVNSVSLRVDLGVRASGTVKTADGLPAKDAVVRATLDGLGTQSLPDVKTDSTGQFTFRSLRRFNNYRISAIDNSNRYGEINFKADNDQNNLIIPVSPISQ